MSVTKEPWWNPIYSQEGREYLTAFVLGLVFLGFFLTSVASCHQTNAERKDRQDIRKEKLVQECIDENKAKPEECYRTYYGHYPSKDHFQD